MIASSLLFVNDHPMDVELALLAFERLGLEGSVETALSGQEAIAYLTETAESPRVRLPSLVILDLEMPGLSGHDVLAVIRAHRALRDIPVVILTSSTNPVDMERSYELGASAHVIKPAGFAQLVDVLERICKILRVDGP